MLEGKNAFYPASRLIQVIVAVKMISYPFSLFVKIAFLKEWILERDPFPPLCEKMQWGRGVSM